MVLSYGSRLAGNGTLVKPTVGIVTLNGYCNSNSHCSWSNNSFLKLVKLCLNAFTSRYVYAQVCYQAFYSRLLTLSLNIHNLRLNFLEYKSVQPHDTSSTYKINFSTMVNHTGSKFVLLRHLLRMSYALPGKDL
jgi:hypothetical protein